MSSRVILPVLGGLAVPGTAIFGFVLSGKYSTDAVLPETFDQFKEETELESCLQDMFPGITNIKSDSSTAEEITGDGDKKVGEETFKTKVVVSGSNTEGCLMVNWDKEYEPPTSPGVFKGRGNGRFLGAMKKVNKGFIVFNTLTSAEEENGAKTLKGDGGGFILERESGKAKWKITMKSILDNTKKISKSDVVTKFPKAGTDLEGMKKQEGWGFITGKEDVDKISEDTSKGTKVKHVKSPFRGHWKGKEDSKSEKTAKEGSSTISAGGNDIYTKTKGDMEQALKDFKGSGEEVYISGLKPKAQSADAAA